MDTFKKYVDSLADFDYLVGIRKDNPELKGVFQLHNGNYYLIYYTGISTNRLWVKEDSKVPHPYEHLEVYYNLKPMTKKQFEEWFTLENI